MNVVRATDEHVTEAIEWMVARGQPAPPRDMFSSTGWCVPGVAAWWLYLSDSTYAWTEWLVANPKVSKDVRDAGIDAVAKRLIEEARAAGTRLLVCNIDREDLEKRAIKHGYRVLARGQTLIGINLKGGG